MKPRFAVVDRTQLIHVSALPPLFRQRLRLEEEVAAARRAADQFADINCLQAMIDLHYAVNLHRRPARTP